MIEKCLQSSPTLFELLLEAGISLFFIGFSLGAYLPSEAKYEFEATVFTKVEDQLVSSKLDVISKSSWEEVHKVEEDLFTEAETEENTFFAPTFAQPFLTPRGWIQRTTCRQSPEFIRPIPTRLTSRYGYRKSPFTGYTRVHTGLDYGGQIGTPIQATETGFVHWARRKGAYGNTVMVTHKNGFTSLYGHLNQYAVKEGDRVQKGQTLGFVGNTGRATGPHLHFEVRCNDIPVNPAAYLRKKGRKAIVTRLFRYKPQWRRPGPSVNIAQEKDYEKRTRRRPSKSAKQLPPQRTNQPRTL